LNLSYINQVAPNHAEVKLVRFGHGRQPTQSEKN